MNEYKGCEVKVHHVNPTHVIIAKQGYGHKDWKAYQGTVPDPPSEADLIHVLQWGNKVRRSQAEELFPDFAEKYEWRT